MFYHLAVASITFYAVVCWGSRVKAADANRLNKLIRKAVSVLGVELESLAEGLERTMLSKLLSIMDNASHPLHATLESYQNTFSRRQTTEVHRRTPPEVLASGHQTILLLTLLQEGQLKHRTLWTLKTISCSM